MDPLFLFAVGVDTAFHRDFRSNAAFTTAVSGANSAQKAFRTRSAARADMPTFSEGAEVGEPDSSRHTTPQATDDIRQPTARSARGIAQPRPLLF